MLDLPILPSELRYVPKDQLGAEEPVAFIYAPINQRQRVKLIAWSAKLYGELSGADDEDDEAAVDAISNVDWGYLFELFKESVLRAENLRMGGADFDPKDEAHVESFISAKPNWAIEVAMAITRNANVTEEQAKN